jgi:uncharacterized coiled-coil protein SlyX
MRFFLILGIGVLIGIFVVAQKIDIGAISTKLDFYVEKIKDLLPEDFETPTKEELLAKKEELVLKISELTQQLEEKKDEGIEKINEIKTALEEAQKNYEETRQALEALLDSAEKLKETVGVGVGLEKKIHWFLPLQGRVRGV